MQYFNKKEKIHGGQVSGWKAKGSWFDSLWRHIFLLFLIPYSSAVTGDLAYEIKHGHSPVVIVVLVARYD